MKWMTGVVMGLALAASAGDAHAGVFDAFKSKDTLRKEAMSRGLNYYQASEAARLVQYSYTRGSGGMTSVQREGLKNGLSWHQARQIR